MVITLKRAYEPAGPSDWYRVLVEPSAGRTRRGPGSWNAACGYARCGRLRNVGEKFGPTLDVVLYQKEL